MVIPHECARDRTFQFGQESLGDHPRLSLLRAGKTETAMNYDRKKLRRIARDVLKIAQGNLRRDGYLQPVGLVYTKVGLTEVFRFRCHDLDQKRASQEGFRRLLHQMKARAAIVLTESWIKMGPDLPLDLTRSVADMPGRKEAIVIEAASVKAKCMIIQAFTTDNAGRISFEAPMEPDHPITWSSEWLDGVWDHCQ
jgi:hypothetical protein